MQDLLLPAQFQKLTASAGITRRLRDRVPSDKEKIISVLVDGKCKEWTDVMLTREEVGSLRNMGVRSLGQCEERGVVVVINREVDVGMKGRCFLNVDMEKEMRNGNEQSLVLANLKADI